MDSKSLAILGAAIVVAAGIVGGANILAGGVTPPPDFQNYVMVPIGEGFAYRLNKVTGQVAWCNSNACFWLPEGSRADADK